MRFILDEMFPQNASKFAMLWNMKTQFFSFFISWYFNFSQMIAPVFTHRPGHSLGVEIQCVAGNEKWISHYHCKDIDIYLNQAYKKYTLSCFFKTNLGCKAMHLSCDYKSMCIGYDHHSISHWPKYWETEKVNDRQKCTKKLPTIIT